MVLENKIWQSSVSGQIMAMTTNDSLLITKVTFMPSILVKCLMWREQATEMALLLFNMICMEGTIKNGDLYQSMTLVRSSLNNLNPEAVGIIISNINLEEVGISIHCSHTHHHRSQINYIQHNNQLLHSNHMCNHHMHNHCSQMHL